MTFARTIPASHRAGARLLALLYAAGLLFGLGGCPLAASRAETPAPLMVCRMTGKPMAAIKETPPCCQTRPALSAEGHATVSLDAPGCCVLVQRAVPVSAPPVRVAAVRGDDSKDLQAGSGSEPLVLDRAPRPSAWDSASLCLLARAFAREKTGIRRAPPVSAALSPRAPPRFFS